MEFNTIHIFAYGEAQIIGKDLNYKTAVGDFKKLQAVIDHVTGKKPVEVVEKNYHAINIFPDKIDYVTASSEGSFTLKDTKKEKVIDVKKINDLVKEFETLKLAADKKKPE